MYNNIFHTIIFIDKCESLFKNFVEVKNTDNIIIRFNIEVSWQETQKTVCGKKANLYRRIAFIELLYQKYICDKIFDKLKKCEMSGYF